MMPSMSPTLAVVFIIFSHGCDGLRLPAASLSRRNFAALVPLLAAPKPAWSDESTAPPLATAYFTAGDARFLQPGFDEIKYKGIKFTEVGSLTTPSGSFPALRVQYDAKRVSYKRVLGCFFRNCDPTRTAEQGQFGVPGPTIIWSDGEAERAIADGAYKRLDFATRYSSDTFGPMYRGQPLKAEIRPLASAEFQPGPDEDQAWYTKDPKAFEAAKKKSGRTKWFEDAYKPVTVTACEKQEKNSAKSSTVCGYVYFPCSDENGCTLVMNGGWE